MQAFKLWSHAFTKIRECQGFDIDGESSRKGRISCLVFSILFKRYLTIFSNNELRTVLKNFESTRDPPEARFEIFLRIDVLAPEFQGNGSRGVSSGRITIQFALLR